MLFFKSLFIFNRCFLGTHYLKNKGVIIMLRYNRITEKNPREIVLLKSRPCNWGRCFFCDYIEDNSNNLEEMLKINREFLSKVTGEFKALEVINSASIFELPKESLEDIKDIVIEKEIEKLYFEAHYIYRHRLGEIRDFFPGIEIVFKTGIESFDYDFRENYLNKGAPFKSFKEVLPYFQSICLMVGIEGQTEDMIRRDMDIALNHFERACINIYVENSRPIKRDEKLIHWFKEEYSYLEDYENIEILWNNTDFGVGD